MHLPSTRHRNTIALRRMLAFFAAARRVQTASRRNDVLSGPLWSWPEDAPADFASLPLQERLSDRLAEAMIAIDDAVQMCAQESDATRTATALSAQILAAYDQVNCIMKVISD